MHVQKHELRAESEKVLFLLVRIVNYVPRWEASVLSYFFFFCKMSFWLSVVEKQDTHNIKYQGNHE